MSKRQSSLTPSTRWSDEQLDEDLQKSSATFRWERMQEPLSAYLKVYDQVEEAIATLLERTDNLASLEDRGLEVLKRQDLVEAFRYLASPPISIDDLKTLADTASIAPSVLAQNPDSVQRLIQIIRAGLDPKRFPWVGDLRGPTEAEREAAIMASTTLMAVRRIETSRRNEGKAAQEERVRQALVDYGLVQVQISGNVINTLNEAPKPGEFCREVLLGERKADFVVGLWDNRLMAVECKVSNSSLNSVKRLNNDAAVKAEIWTRDFGLKNIVPVAVLSGVFKMHNLQNAQQRGLALYWAHRLEDMIGWMQLVRLTARN
jgi:hypothetical protein